jgi:lysophospholipase L1-like esterase
MWLVRIVFALLAVTPSFAYALDEVPPNESLLSVVVLGDSFVEGVGDKGYLKKNDASNDSLSSGIIGYVDRAQRSLPSVDLQAFGYPGIKVGQLLKRVVRVISANPENPLTLALSSANVVIFDVGRNDRWDFGEPSDTYLALTKLIRRVRGILLRENGIAPEFIVPALMLPNRGSQGPWVKELNEYIRGIKNGYAPLNQGLRFDTVSKRLLTSDQIHPGPEGYKALASTFVKYLRSQLKKGTWTTTNGGIIP